MSVHRSAREHLQDTLQRIAVPSFVGDVDGTIIWANDAAKAAFGDLAGKSYTSVVTPDYAARVQTQIRRQSQGARHTEYEAEVILRDGRRRVVEVSTVAIEGDAVGHGVFGLATAPGSRLTAPTTSDLTPRQWEVLHLLAQGQSTDQIAAALYLSRETVRNHIRRVLHALGAHTRIEALAEARRRGLV